MILRLDILGRFLDLTKGEFAIQTSEADRRADYPGRDRMLALPGQPGFDPWCLTDSVAYAKLYDNPKAIEAIAALWKCDPEPDKTLAIQTEIIAALWWGDIAFPLTHAGTRIGYYYCCPWAPIYVARRSVTIGNQRLARFQKFTFDVSAEVVSKGGAFKRQILTSSFPKEVLCFKRF
ncbi:hypothetical protein [Pseudanabaena sp. PCC 6802]|uniref:hypothetical protein n=1 Tax=Pseudanabaena sp. PCC 6802 TaxID=118173 RepID=UPI000348C10B|nr:hypothetical protein [Pseudanabaena sp. PCC 6802]